MSFHGSLLRNTGREPPHFPYIIQNSTEFAGGIYERINRSHLWRLARRGWPDRGCSQRRHCKYGADHPIAFPDTAYFFPTIYAATGVKVKTLGDLPACVGVLKSLITDQEDLGQALNAGLATAVGAEILEGLKFAEPKDTYEQAAVPGIGFVPDPIIRSLGVPLVTGDIPGVAVVLGKAETARTLQRSSRTISPRAS